jgi:drug/metabolite transporter (DMT)-like permease
MSEAVPVGANARVPAPVLPVLVLFTSSIFWGLTWIPLKYFGQAGLSGVAVTAAAHGAICVLAVPYLFTRRRVWWPARGQMLLLAMAGGLANMAFSSALLYGEVLRVMALFYLLPVWGVLGGRWLLGETIGRRRAINMSLALLGAFLVLGAFSVFRERPTLIDGLAVLSGMALALNNILFRRAESVPVASKVAFTFVGSCAWASSCLVLLNVGPTLPISTGLWLGVAAFGIAYLLPASLGTLWAVGQMEAGRSAILIIVELLAAVFSAAIYNGDVPFARELVGGSLIVLAAVLEARSHKSA